MNVRKGAKRGARGAPLNGLRHPPTADTTGWYIWAGSDFSEADDFFQPLHVQHLADWCPEVLDFSGCRLVGVSSLRGTMSMSGRTTLC
jgi:hypothetical protein